MVTRFFLVLALIAATGCQTNVPSEPEQAAEFDPQQFELNTFTGRVQRFLQLRKETRGLDRYDVLFVHTESCTACARGTFSQLEPFLEKADRRLFIYANDSSLLDLVPDNDQLTVICLPLETYRIAAIFHNKIYLYTIDNTNIRSINLDLRQIDSLNNGH